MAEIPFERLLIGLETVARGTAVDPPTHWLLMVGTVTPMQERYIPDESRGSLIANYRSKTVRRWCELEASGPLDSYALPVLAHMAIDGSVTPSTPGGGTNSRLWAFVPTVTSDDIDSATVFWGDPNVREFKAPYVMLDELVITSDASTTDGATMEITGQGHFPTDDAPDSVPSSVESPLFAPGAMQLWIDTGTDGIGTTEITDGRLIGVTITIPTGVTRKWTAAGAGATLNFTKTGRGKRAATLQITLEVPDDDELTSFEGSSGDTIHKVRVRMNGPIIEGSLRHYVEFDIYGPLGEPEWGEHEGSNRTVTYTIASHYDSTLGADYRLAVQNDRASL